MDSATSGLNMTVVGVTTVFIALALLLVVVTIMARIVGGPAKPEARGGAAAAPDRPAMAGASAADRDADLEQVAIAAYALHQAISVSVRGPEPASAWLRAGRQVQVLLRTGIHRTR